MRDIGKNIRSLRIRKGMTQEQFAEKLFVTRQTVSNYETGKSRPDIEMVMNIAQVLETDANTVLYGPQTVSNRERDLRALFISGGVFLVLTVLIALLSPTLREWQRTRLWVAPILLLRTTLLPAQRLFLGWTVMHGLWMLLEIKPFQKSWCLIARKGIVFLACTAILLLLPYCIYAGIVSAGLLWNGGVTLHFPEIPFYTTYLLWIWEYPNAFSVLGALLRIFDFPKQSI